MWAKKESFLAIKDKFPIMEEGILIKMVLEIKKLCKVVKEMSVLLGDVALGDRMEKAAELLDREVMSTQSLYFAE